LFFKNEICELTERETNFCADQQMHKKTQEGPLKPKSVYTQ